MYDLSKEKSNHKNSALIQANDLIFANRDYQTGIVIIGESIKLPKTKISTLAKSTADYTLVKHESVDSLVQYISNNKWNKNEPVRHQIEPQTSGRFFATRGLAAQLNQLNKILEKVFPHYIFEATLHESDDNHYISVHYLGSKLGLDNQKAISPTSEVLHKQVIQMLPFAQKVNLITKATPEYLVDFKKAISEDLLKEQALLRSSAIHGNLWHLLMRNFTHDFKQELVMLTQLVDSMDGINNPTLKLVYAEQVIDIIARVKDQADMQSSFWLSIVHFFIPQASVLLQKANNQLFDKFVRNHAKLTNQSDDKSKKQLHFKQSLISFNKKLEQFIADNSVSRNYLYFFTHKKLPASDLNILKSLINTSSSKNESQLLLDFDRLTSQKAKSIYIEYLELLDIALPNNSSNDIFYRTKLV